ncbi:unnamed protein product [Adineta ricciae]|uniref:Uncharacterized protein n=1 Tax=Adineta ricciae TaxID=249248 RepID=A0A814RGZ8_ADIRI|nr:unnamed protein product [Adineta ricciae]CAF1381853.1 unnamed protein product [Adineta ricciae]
MGWSYTTYTVANYGITVGLVLTAIVGVFATFFSSKKGQEFVIERVIGVNPTKAHDDYDQYNGQQINIKDLSGTIGGSSPERKSLFSMIKQRSILFVGIFCCFIGGMILSITAVIMFQGCVLTDVRLVPGDDCPEYSMDCFVFKGSAFSPITQNATFICEPLTKSTFPSNISDATAWCYSWILRYQSTKSVLDQLGIAIALIGFFTTMLAVVVYLGKCKKTIVLSIAYIISCGTLIIVLLVFKWSFAPLTYAILSVGLALGIFGLILFCILPDTKNKVSDINMLSNIGNQPNGGANSTSAGGRRPNPATKLAPAQPKSNDQAARIIRK